MPRTEEITTGWFERIKELVSSFQPVKIDGGLRLSFLSGNSMFSYKASGDETSINFDLSRVKNEAEKGKIREIAALYKEQDYTFIEDKSKKIIDGLESSSAREGELLAFFKGKLTPDDYKILRISAYIKSQFDKRQEVDELIGQLAKRYGIRGSNLSHLYSSGYFKTHFVPLYSLMSGEAGFKQEDFQRIFDKLVMECPFAIFVGRNMDEKRLEEEIAKRIERNRRYGIALVNIHGIGQDNVDKIRQVISRFESAPGVKVNYEETNAIIHVKILTV